MKWSIVIVMLGYLAISLWCKGGLDSVDGIVEFWIDFYYSRG